MTTGSLLTRVKSKIHRPPKSAPSKPQDPVLDNDDEDFLSRVISESLPTAADALAITDQTNDADKEIQAEVMETAQKTPLPPTPQGEGEGETPGQGQDSSKAGDANRKSEPKSAAKKFWEIVKRNRDTKKKDKETNKTRKSTDDAKTEAVDDNDSSEPDEEKDMAHVLDKLNLAATDNRVFSISEEMQTLLQKFKLILRDLLNGVPTAYNDLESLFKHRDKQLEELFNSLPHFLQKLITRLPDKLAPELLAAAAAKAESSGTGAATAASSAGISAQNVANAGKAAGSGAAKMGFKDMVTKPAAVTGFLRSIVGFLRTRFPALMGANVLWSLAICLLLLVLWYCHKRGREVRLEKERSKREEGQNQADEAEEKSSADPGPTTAGESAVAEAASAEGAAREQHAAATTTTTTTDDNDNDNSKTAPPGGTAT